MYMVENYHDFWDVRIEDVILIKPVDKRRLLISLTPTMTKPVIS